MATSLKSSTGAQPIEDGVPRFIRKLNGQSQSLLIRDLQDEFWVVKPHTGLQGQNASSKELLGAYLCRSLGLPTPNFKTTYVAKEFFDDRRTWSCTSQEMQRPSPGVHFASRFLPDSSGEQVVELLPPALQPKLINRGDCLGIFLFDLWAMHAGRRHALFSLSGSGIHATFLSSRDLFVGPYSSRSSLATNGSMLRKIALETVQSSDQRCVWFSRMTEVLPAALEAVASELPASWYTEDVNRLQRVLTERLNRIDQIVEDAIRFISSQSK